MRTKRVNRYYCDFCRKAGQSKRHLAKHERRCTLNPARECGVCKMLDLAQRPMADLVRLLPEWNGPRSPDDVPDYDAALPALREACGNCPACILAAVRQSGASLLSFDFTTEMKAVWDEINEAKARYES